MRVYQFISPRIFSKLFSSPQLAINAIYMSSALARMLNSSLTATQLAGERGRWTPVKPLTIEQMGGIETWQMTE